MKSLAIITLAFGLLYSSEQPTGNSETIRQKSKNRFPGEFGTVQYEISGKDVSGSATLYFDRAGWRSKKVREVTISRYGLKNQEIKTDFTDGDFNYQINNNNNTGKKSSSNKWSSLLRYKGFEESSQAIYESQGAKFDQYDTILNIPCRKWTYTTGTTSAFWEWRGLVLKTQKKMPGLEYSIQAISLDTTKAINQSVFDLPEGVIWQE